MRPLKEIPESFFEEHEIGKDLFPVLSNFGEISSIPRASGSEHAIREHIVKLSQERNLEYKIDSSGNLLVLIPPTSPTITKRTILQSHLDMVCVGTPDPARHGVTPQVDERLEWITAKDTSLGADDGIGVACMLSLMDEKFQHGPLGLLFTVQEETGLQGAKGLDFPELKEYSYLI